MQFIVSGCLGFRAKFQISVLIPVIVIVIDLLGVSVISTFALFQSETIRHCVDAGKSKESDIGVNVHAVTEEVHGFTGHGRD